MLFLVDHIRELESQPSIESLLRYCAPYLEKVDRIICNVDEGYMAHMTNAVVDNVVAMLRQGKRLRPVLALLVCEMFGKRDASCVALAAAVELVHMATLLHDDVVDNSSLRRGVPTVNKIFDNKTSILAGDYLLSAAFDLLLSLENFEIIKSMVWCTRRMAKGELAQLHAIGNYEMTIEDYIDVAQAKTALLFEVIASSAAILSGSAESKAMASFGRNLGIAFQITDDVLDYGNNDISKPTGSDFGNGIVTMPAILAIASATEQEKIFWIKAFTDPRNRAEGAFNKAQELILKHSAQQRSLAIASKYADNAREAVRHITNNPVVRDMLLFLADFSVRRTR